MAATPRTVFVAASVGRTHYDDLIPHWENKGMKIVCAPRGFAQRALAVRVEYLQKADATIAGSEPYEAALLERCPRLKIIARVGVGYDAIDLEAANQRGVWVTITPGANDRTVAEHTFRLMLALNGHLVEQVNKTHRGEWTPKIGPELFGKTLGIIGLGRIGKRVAQLGQAFGMVLLGYDLVQDESFARQVELQYTTLDELLHRSDWITLHTPLTSQTQNLINSQTLALMKPGVRLVNTARGNLIDEEALLQALREGRVAGAALDVLRQEPPLNNPLLTLPNVIVVPHVGGRSLESQKRMFDQAMTNIRAVIMAGQVPANPVNQPRLKV